MMAYNRHQKPHLNKKIMKNSFAIIFMYLLSGTVWSQTNTFPTSGHVGIGTGTPTSTLDVNGKTTVNSLSIDGANSPTSVNGFLNKIEFKGGGHGALVFHPGQSDERMFGLHSNGNFYWGTGRSATKKDFYSMILNGGNGNLDVKGTTTSKALSINGSNSTASVNGFLNRIEFKGGGHGALVFHPGQSDELMFGLHTNGNFYWGTGRSATRPDYYAMFLDGDTGNLGLRGKLTANEVNIKPGGWADFVFETNYRLRTLAETERFIKENKHLPEIPSAEEVNANGVDLGEMNVKLLQKVEELTLHLIQQQKELTLIKEELKVLKSKNTIE